METDTAQVDYFRADGEKRETRIRKIGPRKYSNAPPAKEAYDSIKIKPVDPSIGRKMRHMEELRKITKRGMKS